MNKSSLPLTFGPTQLMISFQHTLKQEFGQIRHSIIKPLQNYAVAVLTSTWKPLSLSYII
jgi:hypothetical protein